MRKLVLQVSCVALALLLSLGILGMRPKDVEVLTAKPNIVFIIADDIRKDDLKHMPKTRSVLKDKGMIFHNAFVSTPLCCPSRATIMRGQYAHNSEVWNSRSSSGGWQTYRAKASSETTWPRAWTPLATGQASSASTSTATRVPPTNRRAGTDGSRTWAPPITTTTRSTTMAESSTTARQLQTMKRM